MIMETKIGKIEIEQDINFCLNEFENVFSPKGITFFTKIDGKIIELDNLFATVLFKKDKYVNDTLLKRSIET